MRHSACISRCMQGIEVLTESVLRSKAIISGGLGTRLSKWEYTGGCQMEHALRSSTYKRPENSQTNLTEASERREGFCWQTQDNYLTHWIAQSSYQRSQEVSTSMPQNTHIPVKVE